MFEVYRAKVLIDFHGHRSESNLYFLVDNTSAAPPYAINRALDNTYTISTNWYLHLSQMYSEKAEIRAFTFQRIRPTAGPKLTHFYVAGGFPGQFPGPCADDFSTFNLKWHFPGDLTGKHQVRISPLGTLANTTERWSAFLTLAADAFAAFHTTPVFILPGIASVGCINHQTSGGTVITAWSYDWPPGRQETRRLRV